MEISSLPNEMLLKILCYLDTCQLLELRSLGRRWRDLALDPQVWMSRSLTLSDDNKGLFGAVLRLAPCVRCLEWNEAVWKHTDLDVLLMGTTCAAEEMIISVVEAVGREAALRVAIIIRNQEKLGRLRKLSVCCCLTSAHHVTSYGMLRLLDVVVQLEGLQRLVLEVSGDESWDWPTASHSTSKWTTTQPPRASLKHLRVNGSYKYFLEFLLKCDAPTLEDVNFDWYNCRVRASVLEDAVQLRRLDCTILDDMSLLLKCSRLTTITIHIDFRRDEDLAWRMSALKNAKAFLRGAAHRLKDISLMYLDDNRPEVDLVGSLACSSGSAVECLSISCYVPAQELTGSIVPHVAAALPWCPRLQKLDMTGYGRALDLFDFITPGTAPSLKRLFVYAPNNCAHSLMHYPEARAILERNPQLRLIKYFTVCAGCEVCKIGCHQFLDSRCKDFYCGSLLCLSPHRRFTEITFRDVK